MALLRRNITVNNQSCAWCESNEETIEHILTGCGISAGIWNALSRWCRFPGMFVFHAHDLVEMHEHCGAFEIKKMVLHGIIIIACWRMWRARNENNFSNKDPNVVEMAADIKTLGFLCRSTQFTSDHVLVENRKIKTKRKGKTDNTRTLDDSSGRWTKSNQNRTQQDTSSRTKTP
ncbi:reverse transcriptase domain, Reverse transcriptase zinc-binding domain protein [Artemisia annua]|uniref:Reverse transcriptase domain, Reverse transcriptase zinc-binding domain protein n=1 Tax=Artemisia annua TaxID=35608 RepID=A0A2U1NGV3_ARTAN|nr:reverse transcriptase domain, Reverse transcriptase zinc-binding domain protein [Artemisia annua]